MPSGCSGYGTGCNTPSRANSKHSSAARKQEEGTKCTMSMFSRVGLGPFVVLIVLVVVLRHETWRSIVEVLDSADSRIPLIYSVVCVVCVVPGGEAGAS